MKIPLLIAHGEGLITFMFIGIPAALIGIVCLGVAAYLALKKEDEERSNGYTAKILAGVGAFLLVLAFVSPVLGRFVGL
jgi:hypothetical protein